MSNTEDKPSSQHATIYRFIGILFAFLVLALIAYAIVTGTKIDDKLLPIVYILIALMAGAIVATIPGFLNLDYGSKGMTVSAAGGVAAFVLVLYLLMNGDDRPPNPTPVQSQFKATSYCSMTDVYGYGNSSDLGNAQELAIQNCINNGGIPDCCSSNVQVSDN